MIRKLTIFAIVLAALMLTASTAQAGLFCAIAQARARRAQQAQIERLLYLQALARIQQPPPQIIMVPQQIQVVPQQPRPSPPQIIIPQAQPSPPRIYLYIQP